jgi:UDP-N-acetylmuramoyl-L-alanyl-D-glutamate--2,6-diaminopimelate ligase
MGEAAARRADVCIVTSDNPRTEDPDRIIEAIVPGVEGAGMQPIPTALRTATRGYVTITERRHAIREAIGAARPGDTVLLAGRGHEPYQTVGTDKLPLDDRDEARVAIEQETARSARGAGEGKS